jgi:hypothetical protein
VATASRWRHCRAAETVGLDFVDLARANLEDLARLQVDRPEVHGDRVHSRHAGDLDRPYVSAVHEHWESERQPVFLVDDQQPAWADPGDVGQIVGIHLIAAV